MPTCGSHRATSSQQVEYEVQTESGSETVTDTIHDAQAVSLEQLAELPDLAPGGTLQLWSFQIAVSPEGIDPDTVLLSTERGMSMIDGRAYLLDGSRYLAVCLYGKDRYQILSVQHDTDGTALGQLRDAGRASGLSARFLPRLCPPEQSKSTQ